MKKDNHIKAMEMVELFEDLLSSKDIEIPCDDAQEQTDRYAGGNDAKLYGMEYSNLVDEVEYLLNQAE